LSSDTPTTSYDAPHISNITGPGANNASTNGGETVNLWGENFGTVNESAIDFVSYSSLSSPSSSFTAVKCTVVVDHVLVRCVTSAGVGKELQWVVSIAGQVSALSEAMTSYGAPRILDVHTVNDVNNRLLSAEGGTVLSVTGSNFGRASDAKVVFAGKAITSIVYIDHTQLQVRERNSIAWCMCRCKYALNLSVSQPRSAGISHYLIP
jgi:hypothetical protein